MLSVVVPTYNEAGNLPLLAASIANALVSLEYEMLIADDRSEDDTVLVVEQLQSKYPIRLLQSDDRPRDLCSRASRQPSSTEYWSWMLIYRIHRK